MGGKLREAEGLEPVKEPGSGSPQPAGSQLFQLFGKLVTVICPRTEPLLHGSYPFHTPTPPPPSLSATHTHTHTDTHTLSTKIRGGLLLKCLVVEWII